MDKICEYQEISVGLNDLHKVYHISKTIQFDLYISKQNLVSWFLKNGVHHLRLLISMQLFPIARRSIGQYCALRRPQPPPENKRNNFCLFYSPSNFLFVRKLNKLRNYCYHL